jgi:hypothetical protein
MHVPNSFQGNKKPAERYRVSGPKLLENAAAKSRMQSQVHIAAVALCA